MKKQYSSTPYDDVFKSLLNDLPDCLISLVNEMFDLIKDSMENGLNKAEKM